MIASTALHLPGTAAVPGVAPAGDAAVMPEGPDFGDFLAQTALAVAAPIEAPAVQTGTASGPSDLPIAAPQPATTGKMLPLPLPDPLPVAASESEAAEPPEQNPHLAKPVELPIEILLGRSKASAPRQTVTEEDPKKAATEPDQPAQMLAMPGTALVPTAPQTLPAAVSALIPQQVASSAAAPQKPEPEPGSRPEIAATALQLKPATAERRQSQASPNLPPPPAASERPAADHAQPAAAAISQVRLEVAPVEAPRPAKTAPMRAPLVPGAAVPEHDEPAPIQPVQLAAPNAASQLNPQPASPAPQTHPHDFSALVDRLVAAREAAQPHAVSVSLPHADFGRVQLHFRHDDGALAVSLASSDPDFARVAAQLTPPVLPVGEARAADPGANQPGPRGDSPGNAATSHGNNERRQQGSARTDAEARFEHQPRGRASSEKGERRGGIFA